MKTSEDYMLTSENHLLTLEDYLEKDAALFPDKVAITCGEESCTYRQLWNRVTDTAASFHSKGQAIPFVASPTIECLVTYFASRSSRHTFHDRHNRQVEGSHDFPFHHHRQC